MSCIHSQRSQATSNPSQWSGYTESGSSEVRFLNKVIEVPENCESSRGSRVEFSASDLRKDYSRYKQKSHSTILTESTRKTESTWTLSTRTDSSSRMESLSRTDSFSRAETIDSLSRADCSSRADMSCKTDASSRAADSEKAIGSIANERESIVKEGQRRRSYQAHVLMNNRRRVEQIKTHRRLSHQDPSHIDLKKKLARLSKISSQRRESFQKDRITSLSREFTSLVKCSNGSSDRIYRKNLKEEQYYGNNGVEQIVHGFIQPIVRRREGASCHKATDNGAFSIFS